MSGNGSVIYCRADEGKRWMWESGDWYRWKSLRGIWCPGGSCGWRQGQRGRMWKVVLVK